MDDEEKAEQKSGKQLPAEKLAEYNQLYVVSASHWRTLLPSLAVRIFADVYVCARSWMCCRKDQAAEKTAKQRQDLESALRLLKAEEENLRQLTAKETELTTRRQHLAENEDQYVSREEKFRAAIAGFEAQRKQAEEELKELKSRNEQNTYVLTRARERAS